MDELKKREVIFRANMIMIKRVYQDILRIVPQRYPQYTKVGKERMDSLYEILGTNRPYYSKMCNGHQTTATKTMIDAVKDNQSMIEAVRGEKLLNISSYDTPEKWERVFGDKEKEKEVEKSVDSWMNNLSLSDDYVEDGVAKDCALWLMSKLKEHVDKKDMTIDSIVYQKASGFMELTFEQIDECHPATIKRMFEDVQKTYKNFIAVYQYKCVEHSGKKRNRTKNIK